MTQEAMRRRYDELIEKEETQTLTDEETTESVFLFYKAFSLGMQICARHGTTAEQRYGLMWCDACKRAHKPPAHTTA